MGYHDEKGVSSIEGEEAVQRLYGQLFQEYRQEYGRSGAEHGIKEIQQFVSEYHEVQIHDIIGKAGIIQYHKIYDRADEQYVRKRPESFHKGIDKKACKYHKGTEKGPPYEKRHGLAYESKAPYARKCQ